MIFATERDFDDDKPPKECELCWGNNQDEGEELIRSDDEHPCWMCSDCRNRDVGL